MPIFLGMLLQRNVVEIWIIMNIFLWISYYLDKPSLKDFGSITNKSLQYYMLICASLAYIANFINVLILRDMSPDMSLKLAIISYYFLVLVIFVVFLISLNFNVKKFYEIVKQIFNTLFSKKEKNYTNENELV